MPDFIDIALTVDQQTLVDSALARLSANLQANGILGYIPNEGNFEVILLNVIAAMAADVALAASQVPAAIFRTFGTQLLGLAYNGGAAAVASSTWMLGDSLGHIIQAGTQITISSYGFYVESDVTVAPGATSAAVNLIAVAQGTAYNGLFGTTSDSVELVDAIDWVSSITVGSATAGGADAETDSDYQNRLAAVLALQAPRPITASDYAAFVLAAPESAIGVQVGRATAIDGFNPSVTGFTGTTNGTQTVASVSSFTGISVGSIIAAADITAGQTVSAVSPGSSQLTLSLAASASHSAEAMTSTGSYGNSRTITVFVTDASGNPLSSAAMAAIQAYLQTYREVNFLVFVQPPTYQTVYVSYQIHVLPGYVAASVMASVNQALANYLSPALWGNGLAAGGAGIANWLNSAQGFNIVRYNKLLGVIEGVPGVDYVPPGAAGLSIGFAAGPTGVTDLTLPGAAPLPIVNPAGTTTVVGVTV